MIVWKPTAYLKKKKRHVAQCARSFEQTFIHQSRLDKLVNISCKASQIFFRRNSVIPVYYLKYITLFYGISGWNMDKDYSDLTLNRENCNPGDSLATALDSTRINWGAAF